MYKITLYDENCSPICDGTVCFFTEEIEDFQKNWLESGRVDDELRDQFLRSKAGELVTAWYDNRPDVYEKYCGPDPEKWENPTVEDFKENSIETFCWLTNNILKSELALKDDVIGFEVNEKVMDRLFADVIGEAG